MLSDKHSGVLSSPQWDIEADRIYVRVMGGGGVRNRDASLELHGITVTRNQASGDGGGVLNVASTGQFARLKLRRVTFSINGASDGLALSNLGLDGEARADLANVTIYEKGYGDLAIHNSQQNCKGGKVTTERWGPVRFVPLIEGKSFPTQSDRL